MPLTVLVVDDQPLEGEMIALVLKRDRPDAVYVGQALDAADGIRMASLLNPGLIFLDIKMPGMNGLTAISHLHRASPGVHIVMLTAFDDFEAGPDRNYDKYPPEAAANARLLEAAMTAAGFVPYFNEWWHFNDCNPYPVIEG